MKLRITENSLRLRLSSEEEATLLETGRVESSVWLDAEGDPWRYALEILPSLPQAKVSSASRVLRVCIPTALARPWLSGSTPGLALEIPTGGPVLKLIVEADLHG